MSLDAFKRKVLSSLSEERVEVNQRLLIDKILARYSSEFVIYRELIQNSDDAKSSSIQIIFETNNVIRNIFNPIKESIDKRIKSNNSNKFGDKITRIIFKNNGFPFRDEDWNRLKKIAEGNPDEQKIGAFGVGFYSLFSICEEPFVSSGGQGMAFFWQGNQLFTKQGPTGDEDRVWTTFLMDTREPLEFPDIEKFGQFLANSLGFTGNLRELSVYFNDTLVIGLSKKMQDPKAMNIASEINKNSPQKIFQLTSVDVRNVQIDATRILIPKNMSAKHWRSLQITDFQIEKASVSLKIASGNLNVKISNEFSAEMERITKKKPPSKTTIQMIFTGFEEHENYNKNVSRVFKDLLPYPELGRVYIGFSTHQTTGCCSHLAARVIPTVERESIDLAEKTLVIYNGEMLSLAGTLCRILYEHEMAQIARADTKADTEADTKTDEEGFHESIDRRATHALTHFMFRRSTPNEKVGKISESQFFECSKKPVSILSTNGVLPISNVRIPNPEMKGFLKTVPVVSTITFEKCNLFFMKAKDSFKLIEELSLKDVLFELKSRTLSEVELVELLKWWISRRSKGNKIDPSEHKQFMQLTHIGSKSRSLDTICYFLNPGIVPPNMDVPVEVLPHTISKNFKNQDLEKWLNWSELPLVNWARFIVNKSDLEVDLAFAEKVHCILAKGLNNTSQNDKETIRKLFAQKKCIPTKFGMKVPNEAYFQNVNLFPDLPTIQFQKPSNVQNIMELLGVRKVVELQLIFDRLVNQGNWDHVQLIKYLASRMNDLKENDINILKNKPIWPKENLEYSHPDKNLYIPLPLHREFGLPIIDWKGKWIRNTPEGKLLIEFGLQEYPALQKILELVAPPTDPIIRSKALKYFIDNFKEKYSANYKSTEINVAFLPCSNEGIYAKPSECFTNLECMKMNFNVIRQDLLFYAEQFGVCQNPSNEELIKRLVDYPPQNDKKAKEIFEYLSTQQGRFNHSDLKILADLKFIPVRDRFQPHAIIHTNPSGCFFKTHKKSLYEFLTYIDFGEKANRFLFSCGVKNEPSSIEFAELLVKSSYELWKSTDYSVETYVNILRRIAIDFDTIASKKASLIAEMKREPILLAKVVEFNGRRKTNHHELKSAGEIFINDCETYQKIFNPSVAPEDTLLENMYEKLGSRSLRESVLETTIPRGVMKITYNNSQEIQNTIRERANLFFYDYPSNKIAKDVEWLKKLEVREIDRIETTYKLENITRTIKESTTACILQNAQMNLYTWILYVTPDPDKLDISEAICKKIYMSHKWMEISYSNMILTISLSSLERRGYPVDRALQSKSENVAKKCDQQLESVKVPIIITPETTQNLRNSLQIAVKACHSNFGNVVNSQASMAILKESQSGYCDVIPGHLLFCVGTRQGIELYDPKGFNQSEILSQSNFDPLNRFINILKDLASAFEITPQALHVFYDNQSNSIAFNRDKSLFFNLKFYIGLHDNECKTKPTINAMIYWFMTFCHELAHNFIQNHSSQHEKY
ncbi:hypothetical protein RirG_248640 [Rhizophagus irregularis DAOM 197198w]|uniref:Sacsin/Nov domain-containing protein n=1 Tax=Rhizophagus irregularis (strain DAOM 197198w) TaxID=1432141 RepID=A0A015JDB5_RHIIW|nr:hypothetical protein RirG_248640 [Rhizophagus irregularis DAOM 197198w]